MVDFKDVLGKIQNKNNGKEQKTESKELVKFELGILDKYPSVELRYTLVPSNFGVKKIDYNNAEALKSGNMTFFSESDKLISLSNQLTMFEKNSKLDKYSRISYQSKLLSMYKEKNLEKGFIESMTSSLPEEYELHINWLPKANFNGGAKSFKIYIEDIEHAEEIEKELELFRERSFGMILEKVVEDLKNKK